MGEHNDVRSIGFARSWMMIASWLERYMASRCSRRALQNLSDEALADLGLRRRPIGGQICPRSELDHSGRICVFSLAGESSRSASGDLQSQRTGADSNLIRGDTDMP